MCDVADWYGHSAAQRSPNIILPLELHTHLFVELLTRRIPHGSLAAIDFEAEALAAHSKLQPAVLQPPVSVSHPLAAHSSPAATSTLPKEM
jgi:hypothetical protein